MFKYICVFNDDTTKAITTILQISDSAITELASGTTTSTYTYTAPDGLKIVTTRSNKSVKITPPSGKALKYINFDKGSIGSLTTLSTNETLTTTTVVFGNVVLIGYT